MSWSFTLLSSKFVFLTCDAGHGIAATIVDVLKEVKYKYKYKYKLKHVNTIFAIPLF